MIIIIRGWYIFGSVVEKISGCQVFAVCWTQDSVAVFFTQEKKDPGTNPKTNQKPMRYVYKAVRA